MDLKQNARRLSCPVDKFFSFLVSSMEFFRRLANDPALARTRIGFSSDIGIVGGWQRAASMVSRDVSALAVNPRIDLIKCASHIDLIKCASCEPHIDLIL